MPNRLFLIDSMAIVYRAHFAFARNPIINSKGQNTSALFGFTLALLDLIQNHSPTHLVAAFDTPAPTERHILFPEYKAHREAMPEDLVAALPHVKRLLAAFRIPLLILDGFEADDLIGTVVSHAPADCQCFMVTPDKDFGQLVSDHVFLFKPSRGDAPPETLGIDEINQRWGIQKPAQVIDILALMGDASDNIPGVPGIGEKTAAKLIAEFGSLENLLDHPETLKGKLRQNIESNRELALLSKRLATILCNAPIATALPGFLRQEPDLDALKLLFDELEFKSLAKRVFSWFTPEPALIAQRSTSTPGELNFDPLPSPPSTAPAVSPQEHQPTSPVLSPDPLELSPQTQANSAENVPHQYVIANTPELQDSLLAQLSSLKSFCFDLETTGLDPKSCRPIGIAFSWQPHTGFYWPLPPTPVELARDLERLTPALTNSTIEKVGHNLKFDISVLRWNGLRVQGPCFDTMIAHTLVEPEMRHGMDDLSVAYLRYKPIPISSLIGSDGKGSMAGAPLAQVAEYAAEDADVTWQLREVFERLLDEKGQRRVFSEVEMPLLPVLADMEFHGIQIDANALGEFSKQLAGKLAELQTRIHSLAGCEFNLNSPKQLGEVLFDRLKLIDKPKKTKTGQYATDESTLEGLAAEHEIARLIVTFRGCSKLKSTYADALPLTIHPATNRVHTTYNQAVTTTGRLNSQNPNLQNIPIRSDLGQEIRKAFVPRPGAFVLLSADYSQVELRIMAALSGDPGLLAAFKADKDIHTATAAAVHDVMEPMVTAEMRRTAKMVNFGIIYGISAFGLGQRLGIPRTQAARIIENYFALYPGVKSYMEEVVNDAREKGFVETLTGRRRYLRDIRSANAAVRSAAERNAINTPVQGTAADLIKLAMSQIADELEARHLQTHMLLQVHDELLFEVPQEEVPIVHELIGRHMRSAMPLNVPLVVDIGIGPNWLEAHS